jgi:hypothetical protein
MPSSLRSGSATGEAADYIRKCVGCTCTRQGRRSRERAVAVGQERAVAAQRISRIKKHRYDTIRCRIWNPACLQLASWCVCPVVPTR